MKTIEQHYCNCSNCKLSISKKERKRIVDRLYYEESIKKIKDY